MTVYRIEGVPPVTFARDGDYVIDIKTNRLHGPKQNGQWPYPPLDLKHIDPMTPDQTEILLRKEHNRIDLAVKALDVLGRLVHIQGERIEKLEDEIALLNDRRKNGY